MRTRRCLAAVLLLVLASLAAPAGAVQPHASTFPDWLTYHGDRGRSGYSHVQKIFNGGLHVTKIALDGKVYASPLVVHDRTIVATENNTVYAFGPANHLLWKRHLAAPSPQSERPCGDIDPLGITSTPVYYPPTNLVYVAAEYSGSPPQHNIVGIDATTGAVKFTRNIDLPGPDPAAMQLRGALTIAGYRVWASFGALAGDCGNYRGRVVGVPTGGSGALVHYDPSTRRQGGIWNPNGPTVDAKGELYLVSANGSTFPGDPYDHTNTVNKITTRVKFVDSFAPSDWAQNNQGDVGLGSQGVALVGSTWAVLGGKSGPVYVLRQNHLGGIGGQVSVQNICKSFGGAAVYSDVVYLPCTDGVRAVRVESAGTLHVLWHVASTITGSPVVGGAVVWTLSPGDGMLHAIQPWTGAIRGSIDVGTANRFSTPALSGNRVLVGTLTGLSIVTY